MVQTLKDKQHTKNNDWDIPTQMFYYQDVKEAVLEFEKRLSEAQTEVDIKYFRAVLKEIFGNFKEE